MKNIYVLKYCWTYTKDYYQYFETELEARAAAKDLLNFPHEMIGQLEINIFEFSFLRKILTQRKQFTNQILLNKQNK